MDFEKEFGGQKRAEILWMFWAWEKVSILRHPRRVKAAVVETGKKLSKVIKEEKFQVGEDFNWCNFATS